MIGGRVIQIDQGDPVKLWVYQPGAGEMCVHAQDDLGVGLPALGEEIWWQAGLIMFGGPDPKHGEVSLVQIGNSHSPKACRALRNGKGRDDG